MINWARIEEVKFESLDELKEILTKNDILWYIWGSGVSLGIEKLYREICEKKSRLYIWDQKIIRVLAVWDLKIFTPGPVWHYLVEKHRELPDGKIKVFSRHNPPAKARGITKKTMDANPVSAAEEWIKNKWKKFKKGPIVELSCEEEPLVSRAFPGMLTFRITHHMACTTDEAFYTGKEKRIRSADGTIAVYKWKPISKADLPEIIRRLDKDHLSPRKK